MILQSIKKQTYSFTVKEGFCNLPLVPQQGRLYTKDVIIFYHRLQFPKRYKVLMETKKQFSFTVRESLKSLSF